MGFKDLMKSFLYESVEDDDEEEYEEEEEEVIPTKPRANIRTRRKQKQEEVEEPMVQPTPTASTSNYNSYANQEVYSSQDLYTQPKVTYPANSQGQGRSRIDVRAEQEPPKTTPTQTSRAPLPRRGNRQNVQPRQEYSTVISPIFGNMADDEKNPRAVHDAINLPKSIEPGGIGQIISPMYGATTPAPQPTSPIIHIQSTSALAQPSPEQETQIKPVTTKKNNVNRQKTLSAPSKLKKAAPSQSQEKRTQPAQPMTQIISTRPQAIRQQMEAKQMQYEEVEEYEEVLNPPYTAGHLARPEILEEALEDMDLQERADQIANEHLAQQPVQVVEEEIEEMKTTPKPARYLDLSSYLSRGSAKSKSANSDKKKK